MEQNSRNVDFRLEDCIIDWLWLALKRKLSNPVALVSTYPYFILNRQRDGASAEFGRGRGMRDLLETQSLWIELQDGISCATDRLWSTARQLSCDPQLTRGIPPYVVGRYTGVNDSPSDRPVAPGQSHDVLSSRVRHIEPITIGGHLNTIGERSLASRHLPPPALRVPLQHIACD